MLSTLQMLEHDAKINGYPHESNTTRFMRRLYFTSMGEGRHLRDSLLVYCWDHGYELAYRRKSIRFTPHIKLALKCAQRFNMGVKAYQEYVDGYQCGQAERQIDPYAEEG